MRKLMIFSLAFAAASAAYIWLLSSVSFLIAAALCIVGAGILFFRKSDNAKRIRIAAMGAAIGLLWSWGYEQLKIVPLRELCGNRTVISATVTQTPVLTQYGCKTAARLDGGKIMLYLNCEPQELSLGDTVELTAEVADVSQGSGEEENLYFQSTGISLIGFQRGELKVNKAEALPFSCIPAYCAEVTRSRIERIFPEDVSGFVRALLTGDRSGLDYSVRNELSITGISHVVAVSGMHVSLIVGIIFFLCRQRKRLAALVSIPVMLFFAAMLGFSPSVTRAVIMNTVMLLAPLFKRENDLPTALSFALLLILSVNPWAIANLSLQMSFSAMVGIFLLAPKICKWTEDRYGDRIDGKKHPKLKKIFHGASVIIASTFSANVLTLPLTAISYESVSVISPLTNLLTMTLLGAVFSLSVAATVLSVFLPLGIGMAWVLAWPIRLILWLVHAFSKIPYAAVYTCSAYVVIWLIAVYLMLAVFFLVRRGRRVSVLASGIIGTLILAIVFSALPTADTSMTVFDVGQGQCIFAESDGVALMVDCGGDNGEYNGETVAKKLLMSGCRKIDALILTHYDTDHICGAAQLMRRVKVKTLFLPDIEDDSGNRLLVLSAAKEAGAEIRFVTEDIELQFSDSSVRLFVPPDGTAENASICALMSLRDCDILITGDMTTESEKQLMRRHELPKLEVLIAGHHGSRNATCEELLEQTRPDVVLISVGENSYGHPTQETIDRILAVGAKLYRTDLDGDLTILR